jgi:hypothetical protein
MRPRQRMSAVHCRRVGNTSQQYYCRPPQNYILSVGLSVVVAIKTIWYLFIITTSDTFRLNVAYYSGSCSSANFNRPLQKWVFLNNIILKNRSHMRQWKFHFEQFNISPTSWTRSRSGSSQWTLTSQWQSRKVSVGALAAWAPRIRDRIDPEIKSSQTKPPEPWAATISCVLSKMALTCKSK